MHRKRLKLRFAFPFLAAVCLCLSVPFGVSSQEGANPDANQGEAMITMDFQDVDLTVLVKFISELTGKNFILDEKVKGKKVTVISPTKISKEEAYRVFESILEIKDLATVPAGRVIKIVPAKDAMEKSLKTVVGKEKAPVSDTLITQLVTLEYVDPDQMAKILKPLMSRDSKIDAYIPTSTLILTDTASNIARLMRILKQLDVRADEMIMDVIPLEYASAEAMARQLQEILQTLTTSAQPGQAPMPMAASPRTTRRTAARAVAAQGFSGKIIADDRTNSLIVLASETQLEEIRELVHKIDYDTPRAYGNINVYYLEYANAEETAQVLSDLVSGAKSMGNNNTGSKGTGQPAPVIARTMASFEGEVSITADISTNSLLIVATPRDYQTLKNVIEKLDIRRKQVYVEAVIMEIQPGFLEDLGIEYRGAIPLEGGDDVSKVLLGGTNWNMGANQMIGTASALGAGKLPSGDTGLFPLDLGNTAGLTLGGIFDRVKVEDKDGNVIYLPANVLVIHALNRTTQANLLSTPHLIAMDNEEAEIVVGRNVPFVTSTSQSTISTVQSVQRESVGITLRFTPQITEGDYIQLELYQEISALIDSPVGQDPNRVGPTTSERKSTNTVLVRNGQTIIIGGLMEDRIRTQVSKVPYLGDIPGLGWLFRFQQDSVEKQNLLIFLTPTIIREDQDVQRLYEEKKQKMLEYERVNKIPRDHLDIHPFEGRSLPSGEEAAQPQVEEPGSPPAQPGASDAVSPEPDTNQSAAEPDTTQRPAELDTSQSPAEPEYEVKIKGAERLDEPSLPDLPAE